MKSKLLAVALCIAPAAAQAAPVVAFVAGGLGIAAGGTLAATAAYAAGATFFSSAIGKLLVSVGLAALSSSLTPTRQTAPRPSDRMVNFSQAIAPMETVYGRVRKGGPNGFTSFTETDGLIWWRHIPSDEVHAQRRNDNPGVDWEVHIDVAYAARIYCPILASHPIAGVVEHHFDERAAVLDSHGFIQTAPMTWFGKVRVYNGEPGQAADPTLMALFDGVTPAHDFAGLSYAVVTAIRPKPEDFSSVYPRSREWDYAPVIDGHNQIYDPRDGSTGWTDNAALIIAHWLVNNRGMTVDWDAVAIEANAADELVTKRGGGTQKKWTLNGVISDDMDFESQRAQLLGGCDGFLFERCDATVGFYVGRWIPPSITLRSLDMFALEVTQGVWGTDAVTEIAASYIEPDNGWRETPSGPWVIESASIPRRDEPSLFMVASHNQAARMNKRLARVRRAAWTVRATIGLQGYDLMGERFFRLVHDELGLDLNIEVTRLTREGPATFTVEGHSVEPEDFDFDGPTEEPKRPATNQQELIRIDADQELANVQASLLELVGNLGTVEVSWDALTIDNYVKVRYRAKGSSSWQRRTAEAGETSLAIDLQDGQEYEIQARGFTGSGLRASVWSPTDPITITPDLDLIPPPAIPGSDIFISSMDQEVTLSWRTPDASNYHGARVYRKIEDRFFAGTPDRSSAVQINFSVEDPDTLDSITDTPGEGTIFYWIEPENSAGTARPATTPKSIQM